MKKADMSKDDPLAELQRLFASKDDSIVKIERLLADPEKWRLLCQIYREQNLDLPGDFIEMFAGIEADLLAIASAMPQGLRRDAVLRFVGDLSKTTQEEE